MVEVVAPGLARARGYFQSEFNSIANIPIELARESVIFGTVRNNVTGEALPNVNVFASSSGKVNQSGTITAKSDANGLYRLTGLPEEKYRVLAGRMGTLPELAAPAIENVDVGKGVEVGPIDLIFDRGGWVEGVVRDKKTGDPVDGVTIRAEDPDTHKDVDAALTVDGGRYRICLAAGDFRIYAARMPPASLYRPDLGTTVTIEPNQQVPIAVNFELVERPPAPPKFDYGTSFTGRVRDAKGNPLKDIPVSDLVKDRPDHPEEMRLFAGRSKDDGTFRVSVIAGGTHQIEVGGADGPGNPRNYLRSSVARKNPIKTQDGKTYDAGDFVIERYTGIIGGRVLDESGEPVQGANVDLDADIPGFPGAATTSHNEGFTLMWLPNGKFRLRTHADGYEDSTVDAEPGFNYDVTLKRKPAAP